MEECRAVWLGDDNDKEGYYLAPHGVSLCALCLCMCDGERESEESHSTSIPLAPRAYWLLFTPRFFFLPRPLFMALLAAASLHPIVAFFFSPHPPLLLFSQWPSPVPFKCIVEPSFVAVNKIAEKDRIMQKRQQSSFLL